MSLYNKFVRYAAIGVAVTMLLCGCGKPDSDVSTVTLLDPVEYRENTYTVTAKDVEVFYVDTSAAVHYRTESMHFEESGHLGNTAVSIGDSVKKGELLLQLDITAQQTRYDALAQSLEQLKTVHSFEAKQLALDLEIAKLQIQLAKEEGADAQYIAQLSMDIEAAELAMRHHSEQAMIREQELKQQLEDTALQIENSRIYAPFDGVVTYLPDTSAGKVYLSENSTAVILTDFSDVSVRTGYMSEQKLSKYQRFAVHINGMEYPLQPVIQSDAEIVRLQQQGKSVYTDFVFTGEVPQDTAGAIVSLYLYTGTYQNALTVPYQAVRKDEGTYSVYLQRDGKKYTQYVKVQEFTATEAIIASGLEEGDVVYVG